MKEHDNLLSMLDFIETGNNYYLVVRYCRDGDLETRLKKKKKFNETEAVYFLKQIMNGFTELYKHKIMHRDFKLANVFLDRWVLVIGDFGFAKMGQEMASTKLGTPYNMAPELLLAKGKVPYTSKTDLWSIGNSFNFIFLMGYRDLLLSDALWVFAIRGIYNGRVEKRSRQ
jgi:serine/threonine protein kinase